MGHLFLYGDGHLRMVGHELLAPGENDRHDVLHGGIEGTAVGVCLVSAIAIDSHKCGTALWQRFEPVSIHVAYVALVIQ